MTFPDAKRVPEGRLDWARVLCGLLIAGSVCLSALSSRADDEPLDEDPNEKLETRVYQVADLCIQVPEYDFRGTEVPGVNLGDAVRPRSGSYWGGTGLSGAGGGGMGGGMGGMGGGMGGGGSGSGAAGSGGGFFRVPDVALAQAASAEGASPAAAGAAAVGPVSRAMIEELIDAIKTSIAPTFWDELGGNGTIVPFGGRLIVTQTVPIHKQIDDLLKGIRAAQQSHRNVTIRATWALLNATQLATLGTKGNAVPQEVEPAALAKLASEAPGFRGQISCFDGQTVHLVSGRARSQILSAIPVVGGNEAGYQPVTATVQGGVVLQVTPQISADGSSAIIDVRNSVIQPNEEDERTPFLALSGVSGRQPASLNLDRVNRSLQQFMATVRIPTGKIVLVGGVTHEPGHIDMPAAESMQLYLFVEVSASSPPK